MQKILFLRTDWMKFYNGISEKDAPTKYGKKIDDDRWEVFNFQPYEDFYYGWAHIGQDSSYKLNIGRLGAKKNDDKVNDVLVVWVATADEGGMYIVGWYNNATVYRESQETPKGANRRMGKYKMMYRVTARKQTLIKEDERIAFSFPQSNPKKGIKGFGQSNVCYPNKLDKKFIMKVVEYINKKEKSGRDDILIKKKKIVDPKKKKDVEIIAMESAKDYYKEMGYSVEDVSEKNKGWDLEATFGNKTLYIEVKGLSQSGINITFSHKEYTKMLENKSKYRIFVVTNALNNNPTMNAFSYSKENDAWTNDEGRNLEIDARVYAIMKCEK